MADAPLIDRRTYANLVSDLEGWAQSYTAGTVDPDADLLEGAVLDQDVLDPDDGSTVAEAGALLDRATAVRVAQAHAPVPVKVRGWRPPEPGDPPELGATLIRAFGRMAELVVDRLNQIPDRNFLAFLDLVGMRLDPPQPARVPLTFQLAVGSPVDALVPAGTQAAATPVEGEKEPPLFETERDLVVTRSQLVSVLTREPGRDLWRDASAVATGLVAGSFPPFAGVLPIPHRLYVSHTALLSAIPGTKTAVLELSPAPQAQSWPYAVTWEVWGGTAWEPVAATFARAGGGTPFWRVTLPDIGEVPVSIVAGVAGSWIRGTLDLAVPVGEETGSPAVRRGGLLPDAGFFWDPATEDPRPVDFAGPVQPFGTFALAAQFHLAAEEAFSRPGAQVEIAIEVDPEHPAQPAANLALSWRFWNGVAWQPLTVGFAPRISGSTGGPFVTSGTVTFQASPIWRALDLDGTFRRWLQVEVSKDGFGPPGSFRPPTVLAMSVGFSWPLPVFDGVELHVEDGRREVAEGLPLPDRGFANQAPVDLTKDFLPFGEKPKVGDVFYFASEEVFSRPGAKVSLEVEVTPRPENGQSESRAAAEAPEAEGPSRDLVLAWEFWDGARWQLLGESGPGADESSGHRYSFRAGGDGAFTTAQTIEFTVPKTLAPVEVNGVLGRFVRVRIARGNYGVEAQYEPYVDPESGRPGFQLVPATFRPPSLRWLRLGYSFNSLAALSAEPDHVLAENDLAFASRTPGVPFQPFRPPADPDPTLYLGFERPGEEIGFANRSTALYFGVAPALYDPGALQATVLEEAVVVWRYWNGAEWLRLGTRDETRGFTRRGLVTFVGPADFRDSIEAGRRAFWLKASWERGGYAVPPQLARILTNTTWAVHARTAVDEVLGGSRGEPGQAFVTRRAPVLAGQRLEVIEPEVPSALERTALEGEEGEDAIALLRDAAGRPAGVRVRWHEVPDFYGSLPRSRHYTLDPQTGEVRFGDGRRGLIPPPGRDNVRMARYRAGGGPAGNRPAGSIVQLKGTVPYVDGVAQYEPAAGGAARESLEAVRVRGPRRLRHRDRAVAIADYEDLALEASTEVARARGIAAYHGGDGGRVGLVVVPRSTAAKPVPSLELLTRVRGHLEARLPPTVDLWIAGPDWLRVTVLAEVAPQLLEAATDVQSAVLLRLAAFLHPLTGGPDGAGWEFGRKPHRSDLYALIEATPGVDHVTRLEVTESAEEGGARAGRFLVFSGDHRVVLTGGLDEAAAGELP